MSSSRLRLPVLALSLSSVFFIAAPSHAEKLERPMLTVSPVADSRDLRVLVRNVTDYCSTNADTHIMRTSDTIRIIRDRPSRVSRCFATGDVSFVISDVTPGRYRVSYERMPLVAPIRPLNVASTTIVIE